MSTTLADRRDMMLDQTKHAFSFTGSLALATALAAALVGCANNVDESNPSESAEHVSVPIADGSETTPQQISLTGPCTTSTSCDVNYCCTTTDCRFTTTITCTPRVTKVLSSVSAATAY